MAAALRRMGHMGADPYVTLLTQHTSETPSMLEQRDPISPPLSCGLSGVFVDNTSLNTGAPSANHSMMRTTLKRLNVSLAFSKSAGPMARVQAQNACVHALCFFRHDAMLLEKTRV